MSPHVLLLVTSADALDDDHPTGVWLEEVARPLALFQEEGFEVTLASPAGGQAPVDARSAPDGEPSDAQGTALAALADTRALADVEALAFDGLFVAGGHGTMVDLPTPAVGKLVRTFARAGRPVAAVCHGPACLVEAKNEAGVPLVRDRRLTCFSNNEEDAAGLTDVVPFLLETRLRGLGASVVTLANHREHVEEDGWLLTGQNPQSSGALAKALAARLAG